ncbi:membrane protein insertion efficiency factor YidD [Corynebacterium tuscaniense]|uniref:membrane protein insertion efficiency factor YidD n=1 Tax=Corynebacterium tuscaniense TaxID=302449 RepID=UPI0009FC2000|nr:membrane protein insertion efficiency factor YidD [Corynebacterium tuscaniense]KAA8741883.1 membrane protein insertion efficiency factor YidD [Corynebacterium tuscaniense]
MSNANPAQRAILALVHLYQKYLSPLKMGPTCRFEPTCSAYAVTAVSQHGAWKGSWLTAARLCKCGPWHPGGYDPVPQVRS